MQLRHIDNEPQKLYCMQRNTTTTARAAKPKTSRQEGALYSFVLPVPGKAIQDTVTDTYWKLEPGFQRAGMQIQRLWLQLRHRLLLGATGLVLLTGLVLFFVLQPQWEAFRELRISSTLGYVFLVLTLGILLFRAGFFLYQLYLNHTYKPIESVSDEELPTCTVIVPAYNEGALVYHTLHSIAQSNYPAGKLQILALDDGSKDDTWQWMQKAKAELGDRVTILQQPKNMGKRQALYRGFHLSNGEVLVTIDSDSVIETDTLRNLVSPFVINPLCGAVAGNVQVLNKAERAIPKMLNVGFVFSFEFVRAAESQLGSVFCTPGALSAYRREAVFHCLPEWINQTFMGKPSDIGEDRAMTNMILAQGYEVLFQRNAVVYTNVPEKYKGLYKMFIRWGRSNVRENIMMGKFIFTPFRTKGTWKTRLLFFNQCLNLLVVYPFLAFMVYFLLHFPMLFLVSLCMGVVLGGTITALFYSRRYPVTHAWWAFTYGLFHSLSLFWITPYSIATTGRSGWLTRG